MTCAQVRRGARDGAAVAVHPEGRERARRAREVMRAVAASRPVYGRTTGVRAAAHRCRRFAMSRRAA
jgi:histidine ammonia-lyase